MVARLDHPTAHAFAICGPPGGRNRKEFIADAEGRLEQLQREQIDPFEDAPGRPAAKEAELAKEATSNEDRHYAMADYYTRLAQAGEKLAGDRTER